MTGIFNNRAGHVGTCLALFLLAACSVSDDKAYIPPPVSESLPDGGISNVGGKVMTYMQPDAYIYNQRDPVWGDDQLGTTGQSIADYGCTLTALSMAASNLGHEMTPGEMNVNLQAQGGYTPRGWIKWNSVPPATAGRVSVDYYDTPQHADIDACLTVQGGYPLVRFMLHGRVQHWAMIVGKIGDTYLIRDPLESTRRPIRLQTRAPSILAVRCVRRAD